MAASVRRLGGWLGRMLGLWLAAAAATAVAAEPAPDRHLAPGFTALEHDARIVVVPVDVELFSISAGGVFEPRADWTAAAQQHMSAALHERLKALGVLSSDLDPAVADEHAELLTLYAAVARSVDLHHGLGGAWALPTKGGRLDWSFGDAMKPLQERSGARYALFTWVRDSYASTERKATAVLMAMIGVAIPLGAQVGYASLVDLQTGRLVWFNRLLRGVGDLREAQPAGESVKLLMTGFPAAR